MRDDRDPFDSPFFRKQREKREERAKKRREEIKENNTFHRLFGFGLVAAAVLIIVQLVLLGAAVAVVLWVALTVLKHFGVLMVFVGAVV